LAFFNSLEMRSRKGWQQGSGQGLSPAYITLTLSAKRANIARPCVIYTNPIFEQFFGNRR
jgi:hypothetical protein